MFILCSVIVSIPCLSQTPYAPFPSKPSAILLVTVVPTISLCFYLPYLVSLRASIDQCNCRLLPPVGLHVLLIDMPQGLPAWPRRTLSWHMRTLICKQSFPGFDCQQACKFSAEFNLADMVTAVSKIMQWLSMPCIKPRLLLGVGVWPWVE